MPHNETSFYERFLAIRGWIERRTDEPGTVQTRRLPGLDVVGGTRAGGAASRRGGAGPRTGSRARGRATRQLALNLEGVAA